MFGSQGINKTSVIKNFVLVQTGTYQEQHLRPFNVNVTSDNVNNLESATRGGTNLGVSAIQEIAADIIAPSAMTEGITNIQQGWSSRRFRFIMTVEEQHPFIRGTTDQRIFFGYTDHCDASYNHLDPLMRIYFNSETVISNVIEQTPAGPVMRSNMVSSNQIIAPVDVTMGPTPRMASASTHLIRPEDIFSVGQTNHVARKLTDSGQIDGPITASISHSAVVGLGGDYKYSRRMDSSPTRYLSGTLNSFQNAVLESNSNAFDNEATSMEVLLGEATSFSRNNTMRGNTFMSRLRDHAGYMENGYITFRELQMLFPEAASDQVTMFSMDNGKSIRKVSYAHDSEIWSGADHISVGASLIAQTVPSVMMDTFFRSISISVTNGHGPNNYIFDVNPAMTRTLVNISSDMAMGYVMEFERRMKTDILNIISKGNQIPFKLVVSSDLAGETIIDIALGSDPLTRYVAPTFSDSLFTPVITRDLGLVSNISNDLIWLVGEVIKPAQNFVTSNVQQYQHPTMDVINTNVNAGVEHANLGLL